METAGRDRRVRASPKVAPKVECKKIAKAKAKSRGRDNLEQDKNHLKTSFLLLLDKILL